MVPPLITYIIVVIWFNSPTAFRVLFTLTLDWGSESGSGPWLRLGYVQHHSASESQTGACFWAGVLWAVDAGGTPHILEQIRSLVPQCYILHFMLFLSYSLITLYPPFYVGYDLLTLSSHSPSPLHLCLWATSCQHLFFPHEKQQSVDFHTTLVSSCLSGHCSSQVNSTFKDFNSWVKVD